MSVAQWNAPRLTHTDFDNHYHNDIKRSYRRFILRLVIGTPDGSQMTLFKYFPPAKLEHFVLGRVSLSPPKYLNDPFEFAVTREPATQAELDAQFDRFVTEDYDSLSPQHKAAIPFAAFKQTRYEFRDGWIASAMSQIFREAEPQDMQEQYSQLYGVVCLAEVADNSLM